MVVVLSLVAWLFERSGLCASFCRADVYWLENPICRQMESGSAERTRELRSTKKLRRGAALRCRGNIHVLLSAAAMKRLGFIAAKLDQKLKDDSSMRP